MINTVLKNAVLVLLLGSSGCLQLKDRPMDDSRSTAKSFTSDAMFLKKHTDSFILKSERSEILVCPAYQGRVMTSTTGGDANLSFGWLNYSVIREGVLSPEQALGKLQEHIHVFGGEERFWLGPEGGQFALYFKPGDAFEFDDWKTPAMIDTQPFKVIAQSESEATFHRDFEIGNYSGTRFKASIQRRIKVLNPEETIEALGVRDLQGIEAVAYETENRLTNEGEEEWKRENGLLSIWLLGMFEPSADTTIVVPFNVGLESELGPVANDDYFGKVPEDRLIIGDGVLFFSGDGTYRSKIGLGPKRSKGIAGSYNAGDQVLTLIRFNQPEDEHPYVNSMWEIQDAPFAGDVINSYNDGPPEPGADPLGPFYELESSSPAAELKSKDSLIHIQLTVHLVGSEDALNPVVQKLLGTDMDAINSAFTK